MASRSAEQELVNDLRWLFGSPSLVVSLSTDAASSVGPIDIPLDALQPHHVARTIGDAAPRVGHYVEQLVGYWLTHLRGVELLAQRQQVFDDKRTIGELDFVFRDVDGLVKHWETAIKFYLHHKRPGQSSLPGPNPVDCFEQKTERLFNHQLPLSRHGFAVDERQAFVRGVIFHHWSADDALNAPPRLNPECSRGWWTHRKDVDRCLERFTFRRGAIAAKPHWLAAPPRHQFHSANELRSRLDTKRAPRLGDDEATMVWLDTGERLIVVDDSWPTSIGH